ncbi:MAG: hypothetical protein IT373_03810, partial [Polyangiaceae bacterium]|nr:hypothetical protein [Polyangiaceae bacterium]
MLTIGEYATIRTAEREGYRLEEALALEGIAAEDWERDSERWEELCADPACLDSPLGAALEQALGVARGRYARVVEPLETDLEAWVRFQRWYLGHPRPDAALARVGLAQRELARLVRLWAERCDADLELRGRHLALQAALVASPPTEPPEVVTRPREPPLPREARGPREARDATPAPQGLSLETAAALLEAARKEERVAADRAGGALAEPVLGRDEDDVSELADDDELLTELAPAPARPGPPPLVVPLPRLGARGAVEEPPAASQAPLAPGAAPAPVPAAVTSLPRGAAGPSAPLAPPPMAAVPPASPFALERPHERPAGLRPSASPRARTSGADEEPGEQTAEGPGLGARPATPFAAAPRPATPFDAAARSATPFDATARSTVPAEAPPKVTPAPAKRTGTVALPAFSLPAALATPFERGARPAPATPSYAPTELTLEQYASLLEDLEAAPARADGTRDTAVVLARYRLTAADHQALAAVYAARTAADPGL